MLLDHYLYTLDESALRTHLPLLTETLDFFAAIHDELAAKIEAFVELDFETIPREELVEHVRAIADV